MTHSVRSPDDVADEWLNSGSVQTLPSPTAPRTYPKRSELRRAEARANSRRDADRRPAGSRPTGAATSRPAGAPSSRPRSAGPMVADRGPEPARRATNAPWLPVAVAPTAAVLPIRQTATSTRPSGIDLPIPAPIAPDAFHQAPPAYAPMPIAVPYADEAPAHDTTAVFPAVPAPPMAPHELAAPVVPSFSPAEWGLDIDAAPATGRRRGTEAQPVHPRRRPASAKTGSSLPLPARLFGRGRSGAARLLVLALVVGAEGVAVTTMSGHARTAPVDPSTANIAGAYEFTALSATSKTQPKAGTAVTAEQQRLLAAEQEEAAALAKAQDEASSAKVTVALQQAKAAADRVKLAAQRRDRAMREAQKDPRAVGRILAAERGWGASQFSCLNLLWNRESQWKYNAANPGSTAYGIPQSLAGPDGVPGSKMASAGADWRTNPVTQIKWGLDYIADRYGTPCGAWGHSESQGWY